MKSTPPRCLSSSLAMSTPDMPAVSEEQTLTEPDTDNEADADTSDGSNSLTKNESEQRQVEILKTVMQYKDGLILKWGKKTKVLEERLAPLNSLPIFHNSLKMSTLKDRWRKAEKAAEDVLKHPEKFVKLAENGGKEMLELKKLYVTLGKRMSDHKNCKQKEKEDAEADTKDAQNRLWTAMLRVAKRCGYESVSQAEKMIAKEEKEKEKNAATITPPQPEDVAGESTVQA